MANKVLKPRKMQTINFYCYCTAKNEVKFNFLCIKADFAFSLSFEKVFERFFQCLIKSKIRFGVLPKNETFMTAETHLKCIAFFTHLF